MRIRLIAGQFGGRYLDAPDTTRTHPMSERIRGAMFNIIGSVEDMDVLDAFAGSGAIGLEALSRGARHTVFIDKDRIAQKVISHNIALLEVESKTQLVKASVASWIASTPTPRFDLIFVDPPFNDMQLSTVSKLASYLNPKGLMILSHPGRESAPTVNGVVVVDKRSYGDAALAFYHLDESTSI